MEHQDRHLPERRAPSEGDTVSAVRRDHLEAVLARRAYLRSTPDQIAVRIGTGEAPARPPASAVVVALAGAPNAHGVIAHDQRLCAACRLCEVTCSIVNTRSIAPSLSRIRPDRFASALLFPDNCVQCNDPVPCLSACPIATLPADREPGTSTRSIVEGACVGCRECEQACPDGVLTFDEAMISGIACHLCLGDPQCVRECPVGALTHMPAVDLAGERGGE